LLRLQDTYAAVVTFWDAQLGQLLDDLRADGRLDDINIWVTARAGLPLGEHGAIGADPSSLHDELIHVPLVWRMPHGDPAGLRIGALTQPVDLLPTFADLLGVPLADVQGSSLRPLMLGRAAEVRPFACSAHGQEAWLLRTPQWAFHLAPAGQRPPRLHVKPDDRWEVNDVSARQPELVERFESALRRFAAAVVRPGPLHYPALEEA
jgi:arylsulfatase A-like enzyme